MTTCAFLAASVILLAGATAAADSSLRRQFRSIRAEDEPSASPRRIAVFDLEPSGADPSVAQAMSWQLVTEVRAWSSGARVVSSAEIQSLLDLEEQKNLLGCGDTDCLTEIANELGVDEVISGRLGMAGKTYVLQLHRSHVKSARTLGSAARVFRGEDDAQLQAIRETVAEVFGAGSADLSVRAGSPIAVLSAHVAERPGRAFSWVLATGGGAVMVVSGIGLAVAAKTSSDYENQKPGTSGVSTITRDRIACARRLNRVSWGGLAIGGAAATWGIIRLLRSPFAPAVSAAPIPGGVALGLAGMF